MTPATDDAQAPTASGRPRARPGRRSIPPSSSRSRRARRSRPSTRRGSSSAPDTTIRRCGAWTGNDPDRAGGEGGRGEGCDRRLRRDQRGPGPAGREPSPRVATGDGGGARQPGAPPPTVPLGQPVARVTVVGEGARLHGAWARELGVAGWMLTAIDDVAVSELSACGAGEDRAGSGCHGAAARGGSRSPLRRGSDADAHGEARAVELAEARRALLAAARPPTLSFGHLGEVDATVEGFVVPDTTVGVVRFGAWMVPMVSRRSRRPCDP